MEGRHLGAREANASALGLVQTTSRLSRFAKFLWATISATTAIGVLVVGIFLAWEFGAELINRGAAPVETVRAAPESVLAPQPEKPAVPLSAVVGAAFANIEEQHLRNLTMIEREAEARMETVKAMLANRQLLLAVEGEMRKVYQEKALEEVSKANLPHLLLGFVESFGCAQQANLCGGHQKTAQMMVNFWKTNAQNIGEPDLDFNRAARQAAAGYDPATNTWSNGADIFLD